MTKTKKMAGHGSIDPAAAAHEATSVDSFYKSPNGDFTIYEGDGVDMLQKMPCLSVDMVYADPPYFLSGKGKRGILKGEVETIDKGDWDHSLTPDEIDAFNYNWLSEVRKHMKDDAIIYASCSHHNLSSVYRQMEKLGFKILDTITWEKTNPAPLLYKKKFKPSSEFIIFARKKIKKTHFFNYDLMKALNGGKQMRDVWRLPSVQKWEKTCGKHSCQKPLGLLARIIQASTKPGDLILDPFNGSGSTGIAASLLNRNYVGIEKDYSFLALSMARREELENYTKRKDYLDRLVKSKMILSPVLPVPTSSVKPVPTSSVKDVETYDDSDAILKAG